MSCRWRWCNSVSLPDCCIKANRNVGLHRVWGFVIVCRSGAFLWVTGAIRQLADTLRKGCNHTFTCQTHSIYTRYQLCPGVWSCLHLNNDWIISVNYCQEAHSVINVYISFMHTVKDTTMQFLSVAFTDFKKKDIYSMKYASLIQPNLENSHKAWWQKMPFQCIHVKHAFWCSTPVYCLS